MHSNGRGINYLYLGMGFAAYGCGFKSSWQCLIIGGLPLAYLRTELGTGTVAP